MKNQPSVATTTILEHLPNRVREFALCVKKWVEDPDNPGRFLVFFPYDMGDYIKPTKRIIIKWTRQKTNDLKYASILSSLTPEDLFNLLTQFL